MSFIGYKTLLVETVVRADATTDLGDLVVVPANLLGVEVVVTAQLKGQQAAINQQINSNTIGNVVSSERIREVPDNNAAETTLGTETYPTTTSTTTSVPAATSAINSGSASTQCVTKVSRGAWTRTT